MDNLNNLYLFEKENLKLLHQGLHGLEKEALRITSKGLLSKEAHPHFLGSALKNPFFSLDFAEAQLELISTPKSSIDQAYDELLELHQYLHAGLEKELLWPLSTPCKLPQPSEIQLAHFGFTKEAYQKWLYRKGLSKRYGKEMQLLSGVHYSFSLSDAFWSFYHKSLGSKKNIKCFASEQYLHIVRNFLRRGWICSYLFGASSILPSSYGHHEHPALKKGGVDNFYGPYATSIRMSPIGYYSKIQSQNAVSFNTLENYQKDLNYMLKTKAMAFEEIGLFQEEKKVQMNTNILQVEAEHYTRIRPKASPDSPLRPIEAIKEGIEYVETRILDLCPFSEVGVCTETLRFMHLFLLFCLFDKSPGISKKERQIICENQRQVALYGRKKDLKLIEGDGQKETTLRAWALEILENMQPLAELLDQGSSKPYYQRVLKAQIEKVADVSLTPSSKLLDQFLSSKLSYQDFGLKLAKSHQKRVRLKKMSPSKKKRYQILATQSLKELQKDEEKWDHILFGYEDLEFSTQMLLKEAMRKEINFRFYDRSQNLIELQKGNKKARVKQATLTELDSMASYALMENKAATKKILAEKGLCVAEGKIYSEIEEALKDYHPKGEWVVKPNHTNMGVGISFVKPNEPRAFKKALEHAFSFDSKVLVEKKASGDEYRFLVIKNKVIAICKRMPAHLIGDGKCTIQELMLKKNKQNHQRQEFQKPLEYSEQEKSLLKQQGYQLHDVLKKGEKVFFKQNSNVSTGGESIDQTEHVDSFFKEIALKAAQSLDVQICGVDMLIPKVKGSQNYTLIELNYNPALYLHRFPSKGQKRKVEKEVLKALGF